MAASGFQYVWAPVPVSLEPGPENRYGVSSESEVLAFGYNGRADEAFAPDLPPDPSARTPEYIAVLVGHPADFLTAQLAVSGGTLTYDVPSGCVGEAYEAVFDGRERYLTVLQSLSRLEDFSNRSLLNLYASDVYAESVEAWRQCMVEAGESRFADPYEPYGAELPESEQRAVGILDVGCKASTGYSEGLTQFEREWQDGEIGSIQGDVELRDAVLDELIRQTEGD